MSNKIKINLVEKVTIIKYRESIELDITEYPELDGLDSKECLEYVKNNADKMISPKGFKYLKNLLECLNEQETVTITKENSKFDIEINN